MSENVKQFANELESEPSLKLALSASIRDSIVSIIQELGSNLGRTVLSYPMGKRRKRRQSWG